VKHETERAQNVGSGALQIVSPRHCDGVI
jgi:hypothetical protein